MLNFKFGMLNVNFKFGMLNVNSIRHKIYDIHEVLSKRLLDCFMLQETKLDDSFPVSQFHLQGYELYRADHKHNSGGLMTYLRNDLPKKRRTDLEIMEVTEGRIECLAIEFRLCNEKWIVLSLYKEPKTKDAIFIRNIENLLDKCLTEQCSMIVSGDMNIDMLKSNCLQDVLEIQGCKNIVTKPSCFKSINNTLIDIVLTNVHKRFKNVQCFLTS